MARFLASLRRMVVDEAATQRRRVEMICSRPLPERLARGHAIAGLSIERIFSNGHMRLSYRRNLSRFREGDYLCLNRGTPFEGPSHRVVLEQEDETALTVSYRDLDVNDGLGRQSDD